MALFREFSQGKLENEIAGKKQEKKLEEADGPQDRRAYSALTIPLERASRVPQDLPILH